jgi:hypothetical protein
MPQADPANPRARFFQSMLVFVVVAALALGGFRVLVRASELPDWVLTLIVLVVFLSLPIAAVLLWFISHRRS